MQKRHVLNAAVAAAAAAWLVVPAALAASSKPATITVRVEGQSRTLLAATAVKTKAGSITRGGAPAGACPSTSAQGALQDATHGRWAGSWYKKYDEYFISGILGHAPKKAYWAVYLNGRYATAGACELALEPGDSVLFAVVPDKGKTPLALSVKFPATGKDGDLLTATVDYYNAKGEKLPLAGASVRLGRVSEQTTTTGNTPAIKLSGAGKETLEVTKTSYVRTEATISVS